MSYRPCNFFYNVSGEESERLLHKYGSDGEFLARPSESQPDNFTLSICRGSAVTHVKIKTNGEVLYLYRGEGDCNTKSFGSLSELVEYYMENTKEMFERNGTEIVMKRPISIPIYEACAQEVREPAAQLWFHANMTGQEAAALLLREKHWTFLVRESQRLPNRFAISVKTTDDGIVNIHIKRNIENGMFHVGGGDEFRTISDLLAHYNNNPMVEEGSQRVVHLNYLLPSSCVPADAIEHRAMLLENLDPVTRKSGFADEFERIQKADDQFNSYREGRKVENVGKNRYRNILPNDQTRVVLRGDKSDYINANFIKILMEPPLYLKVDRSYIATQGCLPETVIQFWRMIWQENCRVIVMTTKEIEKSRTKCHIYWPPKGTEVYYSDFYVKTVEEEIVKEDNGEASYIKRRLMVSYKGAPQRELFHLQFVGWPDHGCPEHPDAVLRFLDQMDQCCHRASPNQGPVVVHCSAGIGRTGTFIVIDILLNQIRHRGRACPIDILQTVVLVRSHRCGMVQTEEQYAFLYKAIGYYIASNIKVCKCCSHEIINSHIPPKIPPRVRATPEQAQSYFQP